MIKKPLDVKLYNVKFKIKKNKLTYNFKFYVFITNKLFEKILLY